jgi:hypothetical protein
MFSRNGSIPAFSRPNTRMLRKTSLCPYGAPLIFIHPYAFFANGNFDPLPRSPTKQPSPFRAHRAPHGTVDHDQNPDCRRLLSRLGGSESATECAIRFQAQHEERRKGLLGCGEALISGRATIFDPFERFNKRYFQPLPAVCRPEIRHGFGGKHALGGIRLDRDALRRRFSRGKVIDIDAREDSRRPKVCKYRRKPR